MFNTDSKHVWLQEHIRPGGMVFAGTAAERAPEGRDEIKYPSAKPVASVCESFKAAWEGG